MPVAIIDIGSNSIKLLVAEKHNQSIRVLAEDSEDTRISSKSSIEESILEERRMLSAVESVRHLLLKAAQFEPDEITIVATSTVRDAKNQETFKKHIQSATGHPLKVLSGEEEAQGIARGIKTDPKLHDVSDFCLFDLGGGSLELISYENNMVTQAISLPLGAVRLTQKFVDDVAQPIPQTNIQSIIDHVVQTTSESNFKWPHNAKLVATGGAVNVSCNLINDKNQSSIRRITIEQITELKENLTSTSIDDRLAIPALPTKRADIMPTALTIIETIMKEGQFNELQQSYHNLRYGLAAELLEI